MLHSECLRVDQLDANVLDTDIEETLHSQIDQLIQTVPVNAARYLERVSYFHSAGNLNKFLKIWKFQYFLFSTSIIWRRVDCSSISILEKFGLSAMNFRKHEQPKS